MPLIEHTGSLFDAPERALAHGCNCAGAMGKGIAVEFKARWPEMYQRYRELCLDGSFNLGDVFPWVAEDRVIFNLGTQRTWRTKATLPSISLAIGHMAQEADAMGLDAVAIPRIGAGLGGLVWPDVLAAMDTVTPDWLTLSVYSPPTTAPS